MLSSKPSKESQFPLPGPTGSSLSDSGKSQCFYSQSCQHDASGNIYCEVTDVLGKGVLFQSALFCLAIYMGGRPEVGPQSHAGSLKVGPRGRRLHSPHFHALEGRIAFSQCSCLNYQDSMRAWWHQIYASTHRWDISSDSIATAAPASSCIASLDQRTKSRGGRAPLGWRSYSARLSTQICKEHNAASPSLRGWRLIENLLRPQLSGAFLEIPSLIFTEVHVSHA